jgi:hypothetical protein
MIRRRDSDSCELVKELITWRLLDNKLSPEVGDSNWKTRR